jgi:hypothetical protein
MLIIGLEIASNIIVAEHKQMTGPAEKQLSHQITNSKKGILDDLKKRIISK